MPQAIQNTDAFVLMEFGAASKPLKALPQTPETLAKIKKVGDPTVKKLRRNGHTLPACIDLMMSVWKDL
jgi:hypothetical protein